MKSQYMVKTVTGEYHAVAPDQLISAARQCAIEHFPDTDYLKAPAEVRDYLRVTVGTLDREVFGAIWLSSQHQVLEYEELFVGTINASSVYPREVIKSALDSQADAVVFFHNHPSGESNASLADKQITAELKKTLELIGVRTLDHLIVGREFYSFAQHGII